MVYNFEQPLSHFSVVRQIKYVNAPYIFCHFLVSAQGVQLIYFCFYHQSFEPDIFF